MQCCGRTLINMPTALHHVTVFLRGGHNVIRLLQDVLGLPLAVELMMKSEDLGPLADWCEGSSSIRTLLFGNGSAGLVELIDLGGSGHEEREVPGSAPTSGASQLCFAVRDIEGVLDACRNLSVVFQIRGRQNIEIQDQSFSVAVLIVDGLRIQLSQLCARTNSPPLDHE
jgi:hypothetical protein